jgi:xanthine dehydrogenase YagT iron-sulfur-binding subunit
MCADNKQCACRAGVSRRDFIKTVGAGAAAAAITAGAHGEAHAMPEEVHPLEMVKTEFTVNGVRRQLLVEPRWTLLFVLREKLGLTGAKQGCGRGECGSCTVLIDDEPRYACMTLALEVEGKDVETVEGLMEGEELGPVQAAFVEQDALQCGYCTPGQIMAAEGLLRANPEPDYDELRVGMSGNLCRCGVYDHIFKAVQDAAARKKA